MPHGSIVDANNGTKCGDGSKGGSGTNNAVVVATVGAIRTKRIVAKRVSVTGCSGSGKSNTGGATLKSTPKSSNNNNASSGGKGECSQDSREMSSSKKKSVAVDKLKKQSASECKGNVECKVSAASKDWKGSGNCADQSCVGKKGKNGASRGAAGVSSGIQQTSSSKMTAGKKKEKSSVDSSAGKKKGTNCNWESSGSVKQKNRVTPSKAGRKKESKERSCKQRTERRCQNWHQGKVKKATSKNSRQLAAKKALRSLKSMFGFWKGPRLRRMASLNAQAKVHILYENEARSTCSDSDTNDKELSGKDSLAKKGHVTSKAVQKRGLDSESEGVGGKKRCKVDSTVPREVMTCRRMASLNAQAILAASYSPDRPRKQVKVETEVAKKNGEDNANAQAQSNAVVGCATNKKLTWKSGQSGSTKNLAQKRGSKKNGGAAVVPAKQAAKSKQVQQQSLVGKKKQEINVKDTGNCPVDVKSEKDRTEKLEDTEVTITGVYINPNASICISRVHTYKQSQTFSPPPSPPPSQGQASVHLAGTPHLVAGGMLHSATHLPTGIYSFANSVMSSSTSQTYPLNGISNHLGSLPVVNVTLPRYGNTFTVPHFGHSGPITYTTHGYYQPAGPLIQTITDPCLIHKPVPYHPHLQQTSPAIYPQEQCHPTPPQGVQYSSHDQCPPPPHPTPPYSAQPCSQTECAAMQPVPPSTGHFSQDRCHSHPSPQEGFFPEHCPAEDGSPQPFQHMQQQYQASASSFKAQVSPQYPSECKQLLSAPTLHIQPKEECLVDDEASGKEDVPSRPPVLTPIKTLCTNIKETTLGGKKCRLGPAMAPFTKDELENESVEKSGEVEKKTTEGDRTGSKKKNRQLRNRSSNLVAKVYCRRELRHDVSSLLQHKLDRFPRENGSGRVKLLRSDVRTLKPRRVNSSSAESARRVRIKKARALWQRSHGPELRVRCPNNTNVQLSSKKVEIKMVVKESLQRREVREETRGARGSMVNGGKGQKMSSLASQTCVPSYLRPVVKLKMLKRTPRYSNGWTWEGEGIRQPIQFHNDDPPVMRKCYPAMRHIEGDIIRTRDCVLLKSGTRKNDLPFVAKIVALWENPDDGEMMLSLLWYYRPEHTELGRKPYHMEDEIFASKHKDINSVACIEDKCYVLTFNEYCRYRRRVRLLEESVRVKSSVVPDPEEGYTRKDRQPTGYVAPEMVFFCRKVYDFRQKRILKNPS